MKHKQYLYIYYDPTYGLGDCPKRLIKYAESYKFKYTGSMASFGFMNVEYIANINLGPIGTYSDFVVKISDSIYGNNTIENLLKRTASDSVLYHGKYHLGIYFVSKNILYNQELGIIKFIDQQNETWQLVDKK